MEFVLWAETYDPIHQAFQESPVEIRNTGRTCDVLSAVVVMWLTVSILDGR